MTFYHLADDNDIEIYYMTHGRESVIIINKVYVIIQYTAIILSSLDDKSIIIKNTAYVLFIILNIAYD